MSEGSNTAAVTRLLTAFRARDLDAFIAELHPEIVVEGNKGTFRGHDEVRRWATPSEGGELYLQIAADELREIGSEYVAADACRRWLWREGDELAEESRFGILFRFRDGKIVHWRQTYASIADALEAIPAA